MADYEKEGEETSIRGVDWEVVSLTASAYGASPTTEGIDMANDSKDKELNKNDEEYARAMFMSGHFIFPPSEHENLPIEPEYNEILTTFGVQDVDTVEEANVPEKTHEENRNSESLSEASDLHVVRFLDKGESHCSHNVEFENDTITLQGLKLVEEEKGTHSDPSFIPFHNERDVGGSVPFNENSDIAKSDDPPNQTNQHRHNVSRIPDESWWKRQAAQLYAQAKEASTFWSLCVAAAMMGLVILGQQWQQEKWQFLHLKSQFSFSDEKINRLLGPVTRFKDVIVGSHRRVPVLRDDLSSGH